MGEMGGWGEDNKEGVGKITIRMCEKDIGKHILNSLPKKL